MKKTIIALMILIGFTQLVSLQSCTQDNVEDYYTDPTDTTTIDSTACQNTTVSYSTDVLPILTSRCLSCHNQANHNNIGAGILLEGYAALQIYVNNGDFLCAVLHGSGCEPMPLGQAQIPAAEVTAIENWVNEGACDN